jgi:hypothetical protein
MICPKCGNLIKDNGIDLNNLMLPDIWFLEATRHEEKEVTLPISGLTARIKEGKIILLGDGITVMVKNTKVPE